MTYILGLDLSLNNSGFALIDDNELILFGNIPQSKTSSDASKLTHIAFKLEPLIQLSVQIKIESAYAGRNIKTMQKLMLVHGLILYFCGKYNKPYTYYSPMTIKKNLLGNVPKKDSKIAVYNEVLNLYPVLSNFKIDDNMTDAIAAALCN